jgi:hypothetical protein
MAQFINVTSRYGNNSKRYAEALVATCPARLDDGGQRTGTPPTYVTSGDSLVSNIIEPNTVVKKVYLRIKEAFPAGTKISVDIAGTAYFTDVAADVEGLTVSTTEDQLYNRGQAVSTAIVNGPDGTEITEGVAEVIVDGVSINLKNGNYSAY